MRKIAIFGNSGSGKSTLAKHLCETENLAHLDLDSLAWQPGAPPVRKPWLESKWDIMGFIESQQGWVIEGCYSDLLEIVVGYAEEIIYMDLPIEACIANAKARPWETHKYESMEAQNANLDMLIEWIADYPNRIDSCSQAAHEKLYKNFAGKKTMLTSNQEKNQA